MDETQGGDIRPLLLRGSGYLLFYRLNHDVLRVEVLSVWHARRLAPSL
jgi:plasmid stabilization system protein ParE